MNPKTIYFCHKTVEIMKNYPYTWQDLNTEYDIQLYDDNRCINFLHKEFGIKYVDIFNYMKNGAIKADFWRVCILYKYGGFYSDVDNQPLVPINNFIEKDIDFLICSSFSPKFKFNPNFIFSKKDNKILKKCIDWYVDKFDKKIPFEFWEYSIMTAFNDILNIEHFKKEWGIYFLDNLKIQIIKEYLGKNHYDAHNIYGNKRVFNNRYQNWNCQTRTFDRKINKSNFSIPKGTNLNYYLLELYNLFLNFTKQNNITEVIIFNDNPRVKESLWLNRINFTKLSSINKLTSIYNHLIRIESENIVIINLKNVVVSDINILIENWKKNFSEIDIIIDNMEPLIWKENNTINFLLESNLCTKKKILLEILNRYFISIQKRKNINIQSLLINLRYKVINSFFSLYLKNINKNQYANIIQIEQYKFLFLIVKISFILSLGIIWLFTLFFPY